jgi:ATP-dependent exoDNAse (exonuclease V) alpha subunit
MGKAVELEDFVALTNDQASCLSALKSGTNALVTGSAGTGKSFVISEFIRWCGSTGKNVMVTAPTGIAALNIGGTTLHRAFRVPLEVLNLDYPTLSAVFNGCDEIVRSLPRNGGEREESALLHTDVLIIDEISMCRIDLFDYIAVRVLALNFYRQRVGKQAIQVVLVGDFLQLPPVVLPRDKEVLNHIYGGDCGKGYAFQSRFYGEFGFKCLTLREVVRQKDAEFSRKLRDARVGFTASLQYFADKQSSDVIKGGITLTGKNNTAFEYNSRELAKIKGKEVVYTARETGTVKQSDKANTDTVSLKVGARVMSLVNGDKYSNGSLGTVIGIKDNTNRTVVVEFDSGESAEIEPYDWEVYSYEYDKEEKAFKKIVVGTFTQIPLKLGYAITIHKSQGQTYDSVNIDPVCWEYGQLYTALSRCKSVDKMHFLSPLKYYYLKAAPEVVKYYLSFREKG